MYDKLQYCKEMVTATTKMKAVLKKENDTKITNWEKTIKSSNEMNYLR